MNCKSTDDIAIGSTTLRQLEKVVLLAKKFERALTQLQRKDKVSFTTRESRDYDGWPYEDHITVTCQVGEVRTIPKDIWSVTVGYSATHGDDCDYIAIAHRDRSTAHKIRPAGPGVATRFKLENYWTMPYDAKGLAWLVPCLDELSSFLLDLDTNTETMAAWAASGMSMTARCKYPCERKATVESDMLAGFAVDGLTIDQLSKKMVCKVCGNRAPELLPLLDADRLERFLTAAFLPVHLASPGVRR